MSSLIEPSAFLMFIIKMKDLKNTIVIDKRLLYVTLLHNCNFQPLNIHTLLASPYGKKFPYIFLNSSTDKCPLGQSFKNPLYHSCISASANTK